MPQSSLMGTEVTKRLQVFAGKHRREGWADTSWHPPALQGQHTHVRGEMRLRGGWWRELKGRQVKGKRLVEREEGRQIVGFCDTCPCVDHHRYTHVLNVEYELATPCNL